MTEVDGRPSAEPLDTEEAAERRAAIGPVTSRRAGLVVGALAAGIIAVVGIWTLVGNEPSEPRETVRPSRYVVELDAETGQERQQIAYPSPGRPEIARFARRWRSARGASGSRTPPPMCPPSLRVDPRHGEMRRVVVTTSLATFTFSIATAFDAVWVATDELARINPATEEVRPVLRIPMPAGATARPRSRPTVRSSGSGRATASSCGSTPAAR